MVQIPPASRRSAWRPPSPPVSHAPARRLAPDYGRVYRPRRPTETPLYPVVQHHLETFLAEAQDADPMGWGVPRWVERGFRSYLRCGIPAHGFARVRCTDCGHDRLLAFSCKGRGVCPSCNAQHMAEVAVHLTDEVIPHLPTRQWVLPVPKRLRPFLHQTPEVASAVLGIFLRALRSALRDASPGAPDAVRDAQLGAISFSQRFGSSLNPHDHDHVLALDGVISGDDEQGVRFHEATGLKARDAVALAGTVQLRVLRWFVPRGFLDSSTAAHMRTWRGTGGCFASSMLSAFDGSVDGSVRIEGADRAGLERLVRYCARGPPLWSGFTPPPVSRRSPRRRLARCTGSPSPMCTVARCFASLPSSSSTASPASCRRPASIDIATTGFWLPTRA